MGSSFSVKAFIFSFADGWYNRWASARPYAGAFGLAPCHTPVRSGFPSHDARGTALAGVAVRAPPLCWAAAGTEEAKVKNANTATDAPIRAAPKAFPMLNDSCWNGPCQRCLQGQICYNIHRLLGCFLMEFLTWLENLNFSRWVANSTSIWAYPSVLTLHTIGMGLLVGTIAIVDLRILGVAPVIPLAPMESFLPVMWLGFWMNALSGTTLFIAGATRHATNPFFYIKMTCIALGVVNIRLLRRRGFRSSSSADAAPIPMKDKVLASTSLALWAGAITAGRLMAYYSGGGGRS